MPNYDYKCECGFTGERFEPMDAPTTHLCPACGKETYKRQISAPGISFSGGGWFSDGYAKK